MKNLKSLVLSAMLIAIGIILPFFTGQIEYFGERLLPMHLPVFLAGLICSWKYGAAVGFTMPLLRSFIFHRPALYPDAVVMMLELAAYGFVSGIIYNKAPKRNILWVYISLVSAMLAGRLVWGIVKALLLGTGKFGLRVFITSGFVSALPGIILQLVLIPAIMVIIEKLKPRA